MQPLNGPFLLLTLLLVAGCGAPPSEPQDAHSKQKPPVPTVFDPLVQQRQQLPARAEAALQQHDAEIHRQVDASDAAAPGEPPR